MHQIHTFSSISLLCRKWINVSLVHNISPIGNQHFQKIYGVRFISKFREISNTKIYVAHVHQAKGLGKRSPGNYYTLNNCCGQLNSRIFGKSYGGTFIRSYANQNVDPTSRKQKINKLLGATYVSIGIGVCLLLAILWREVNRIIKRFEGVEEVVDPNFGRRALMIKYKDVILPIFTSRILKDIENFEVREDDVWVVSYPRSGTTWLQEIVYLIRTNLNFTAAKNTNIEDRFPYLEYHYPGLKSIRDMPSPRLIKSHLPLRLLPQELKVKCPKVIYIVRNPKDVLVSYYHYAKMLRPITRFNGTLEDFYKGFINDKLCYSPWWRHVKEFWDIRQQPNVLFVSYEDMQKDVRSVIRTIAEFLGKSLSEEDVKKIAEHCEFGNMKKNETVNFAWWKESGISDKNESEFLRKGEVGDWKNVITDEMNKRIERMVIMKFYGSGLDFKFELSQDNDSDVSS